MAAVQTRRLNQVTFLREGSRKNSRRKQVGGFRTRPETNNRKNISGAARRSALKGRLRLRRCGTMADITINGSSIWPGTHPPDSTESATVAPCGMSPPHPCQRGRTPRPQPDQCQSPIRRSVQFCSAASTCSAPTRSTKPLRHRRELLSVNGSRQPDANHHCKRVACC
jgi:hypothetical protein